MKKPTNAMSLKTLIKNIAKEKNISAQLVLQNYVLERLLVRIANSTYKNNFIIKGGFLISSMLGLDTRTTKDMDTTIKGFSLTEENLISIFTEICSIDMNDNLQFVIERIEEIREDDEYNGYKIHFEANYLPLKVPFSVDVTTGDKITPSEIEYSFPLMFDEGIIKILSYNIETILAEKLETIISRGIANRRIRDFYDVYILWKFYADTVDIKNLAIALEKTSTKRGSFNTMKKYKGILKTLVEDKILADLWLKYTKDYEYAKGIKYNDIFIVANEIMDKIF